MNRKSQITYYIIAGIVVIAAIGMITYLANSYTAKRLSSVEQPATIESASASLTFFTTDCIKKTLEDALLENSLQAGYTYLPEYYLSTAEFGDIPFYYYNGIDLIPSKEELEVQYALFVDDNLRFCLNGYDAFTKQGLRITAGEADSTISFDEGKVGVMVDMPVTIQQNQQMKEINKFQSEYPARMKDVYEVAQQIVEATANDPYNVDYTNLFSLMDLYEVQIDFINYEDGLLVYVIRDDKTTVHNGPLVYAFAIGIDMQGKPVISISGLTAKVGEEFTYYPPISSLDDESLTFSDDTELFDIDPSTGLIKFTPTDSQKGENKIKITATDSKGTTTKELVIKVE